MPADRTLLGVMAKHWTPGAVKTRLAASIGERQAASVYLDMLKSTLCRFACRADERIVAFTPSDCRQRFAEIVNGQWTLQPQGDGDLGDRLADFFARAFDRGFTRVVVIGADTPTLPIEFVMGAFAMLKRRAAVFGPSADGGYYLIGAAGRLRGVFESIPWGTSEVWTLTRRRMEQAGLSWGELPAWWDVDDERDYRRLLAEGYRMSS